LDQKSATTRLTLYALRSWADSAAARRMERSMEGRTEGVTGRDAYNPTPAQGRARVRLARWRPPRRCTA